MLSCSIVTPPFLVASHLVEIKSRKGDLIQLGVTTTTRRRTLERVSVEAFDSSSLIAEQPSRTGSRNSRNPVRAYIHVYTAYTTLPPHPVTTNGIFTAQLPSHRSQTSIRNLLKIFAYLYTRLVHDIISIGHSFEWERCCNIRNYKFDDSVFSFNNDIPLGISLFLLGDFVRQCQWVIGNRYSFLYS